MTDDLHDIQGTATLLVRCPDGMQASFCALKFEKGGMASNYGTAEQKLSNTGIDISEGKILLTAETTTIDGDLQLNGIITENTTDLTFDEEGELPTRKLFCVDMKNIKSCVVPYGSLVFLPAYHSVIPDDFFRYEGAWAEDMPEYRIAGTKLNISCGWMQDVSCWPILMKDENGLVDISLQDDSYDLLENRATLVCADPRFLDTTTHYIDSIIGDGTGFSTDFVIKKGDGIDGNLHGNFLLNGVMTRFILLLPGQTLRLKSSVMYLAHDSNSKYVCTDSSNEFAEPVLFWDVENADEFTSVKSNLFYQYHKTTEDWEWVQSCFNPQDSPYLNPTSYRYYEKVFGPKILNVDAWSHLTRNDGNTGNFFRFSISDER